MSKMILLAEDSPDDEILFRRVINSLGIMNPVHVVRDGREAIAFIQGDGAFAGHPEPAVLFLDLKMPGMDGLEVLKWLLSQKPKSEMLIVVLTAYGDREKLQDAYQLGAHSFLLKPIKPDEVQGIVKHWPDFWMFADPIQPQSASVRKPKKTSPTRKKPKSGGLLDAIL
jgi:two-component system response regulator